MKIRLTNGGSASQAHLDELENILKTKIPFDVRQFVLQNDGSEPETNIFKIGQDNDSGVNLFIPIKNVPQEMLRIENLPKFYFPIAWAEGGNYVLVDANKGAAYFWDHERPQSLTRLSDSFSGFLDQLQPFDANSVKLKPGQVTKAWINPEFLKNLKNEEL